MPLPLDAEIGHIERRMQEVLDEGEKKVQERTFKHSLKLKEWSDRWTENAT